MMNFVMKSNLNQKKLFTGQTNFFLSQLLVPKFSSDSQLYMSYQLINFKLIYKLQFYLIIFYFIYFLNYHLTLSYPTILTTHSVSIFSLYFPPSPQLTSTQTSSNSLQNPHHSNLPLLFLSHLIINSLFPITTFLLSSSFSCSFSFSFFSCLLPKDCPTLINFWIDLKPIFVQQGRWVQ